MKEYYNWQDYFKGGNKGACVCACERECMCVCVGVYCISMVGIMKEVA